MFESIRRSLDMYTEMFNVMMRHKGLLVPFIVNSILMLILYSVFIGLGLSFIYGIFIGNVMVLLVSFFVFCAFSTIFMMFYSIIIVFSNTWLLEILEGVERDGRVSASKAFGEFIFKDLLKVLSIGLLWIVIVILLGILISWARSGARKIPILGGLIIGILEITDKIMNKGLRLYVFLSLPAIAWEDKEIVDSLKRSAEIFKARWTDYFAGFATTAALNWLILYPASFVSGIGILFIIAGAFYGNALMGVVGIIIFIVGSVLGVIGTHLGFYIEQMYMGILYLWHRKWEVAVEQANKEGKPVPDFNSITPPSFVDEIKDL